ncbi:MAG: hypothetical protein QXH80_01975 [Candidatus Nanoarchaeia archaeon]
MSQILDKVLEIVQKSQGGALPVDVASKLGVDSFLANAYLSQLVDSGKIVRSNQRIGGTNLYFMPGQEKLAESKINTILEQSKKTAKMYAPEGAAKSNPEIEQKRAAFVEKLKEIESKEKKPGKKVTPNVIPEPGHKIMPITIKHVSQEVGPIPERAVGGLLMPKPKPEPVIEKIKEPEPVTEPEIKEPEESEPVILKKEGAEEIPEPEEDIPEPEEVQYNELEIKTGLEQTQLEDSKSEIRNVIEKTFRKKPEKPMEPGPVVNAALAMLVDSGAEIIGKELKRKGKDADIIVDIPSKVGNIRMLAIVRDKKTITEADLSMAYTEGANKKLLVLFCTPGKLTKLAKNYHEVISGLVKFKPLEIK